MEAIRATPPSPARVNVRALRAGLAPILSMVEDHGHRVVVTRKGKAIAQIVPADEEQKTPKKTVRKCVRK